LDFLVGDKDRTYLVCGMVIVVGVFSICAVDAN